MKSWMLNTSVVHLLVGPWIQVRLTEAWWHIWESRAGVADPSGAAGPRGSADPGDAASPAS
jgi:hypothetical protein